MWIVRNSLTDVSADASSKHCKNWYDFAQLMQCLWAMAALPEE